MTTPAKSELDAARERLEAECQRFKECYKFDPEHADVRLVLDALREARSAFASYKYAEGCGCCRDQEAHDVAEKRLAAVLDCKPYDDGSGFDWDIYRTKEPQ